MSNSLISADVLSTAFERYKNTLSKVIFNINFNKNKLETSLRFCRGSRVKCRGSRVKCRGSRVKCPGSRVKCPGFNFLLKITKLVFLINAPTITIKAQRQVFLFSINAFSRKKL